MEPIRSLASFPPGGVALVLGAGGIGSALVRRLRDVGRFDRIVVGCRSPDKARPLASHEPGRAKVLVETADLLDAGSLQSLARTIGSMHRPLRLAICATGLLHQGADLRPERRLEDVTRENLEMMFAVNAIGPLLAARYLVPVLPRLERSVFAAISARVGSIGDNRLGGWYGYRGSKAALNQFLRCTALELRRRAPGAIVAALHPGTVATPLSKPFQAGVPADRLFAPEYSATRLLEVIDGLSPQDSGGFFAWDGGSIPW